MPTSGRAGFARASVCAADPKRADRERRVNRTGCSYFGVRILRHVRRDLEDIAARGYTAVLHTFSENDLAYYRGEMAKIVAASHDVGLEVQMGPWGLGNTFGGEAESRWVAVHPEAWQVLDDGRPVGAACLNQPSYREFCRGWADAAVEAGADYVFWDEPHWAVPEHLGADPARWACYCVACRERFGAELPRELTPELLSFREASLVDFLREMAAHVASRGGRSTICLLPVTEGAHGVADWDAVASLPGVAVLATDPYWKNFEEPAQDFVGRFARLLAETTQRHGVGAQLWLPSFGLTRDDIPDLEAAVEATRAAGIDDVWTWAYEACGHMTSLATPDSPLVWEAVTRAITGRSGASTERHRSDLLDLDLRPTLDLVRLINAEDRTVPEAVAAAARSIAAAIDEIVPRLERGGRLVYVGAGSSGRMAEADASECGPTFSTTQVLALTTADDAAEDDTAAGARDVAAAGVGPDDVALAVSASGRTPYTLAALDEAARAGAYTVALVCADGSELGARADHELAIVVGPEVIAGSTRMKAGTAQKLVLNMLSTITMVRLGKTFGNLMVEVELTNEKLRARARTAVALATAAPATEVDAAFAAAAGNPKVAIVSLLAGVDADDARARLDAAGGVVREAVGGTADVVGRS
jgi:N-acetylmuramic acid 6-phosphate etherase